MLDNGRPRLDPEGATVGGFRTMVEAVAMRTFGLGGDSEVALEDGGLDAAASCSGRAAWCRWRSPAWSHGEAVIAELERQLRAPNTGRMDGRFAVRTGVPERLAAGLTAAEAKLYDDDRRRAAAARPAARPRPRRTPRSPAWCRAAWCMSPASRPPTPPMC